MRLDDVARALSDAGSSCDRWLIADGVDPMNGDIPAVLRYFVSSATETTDRLSVFVNVYEYIEEGVERWRRIERVVSTFVGRLGGTVHLHEFAIDGGGHFQVQFDVPAQSRPGNELLEAAEQVEALINALDHGPLGPETAADLLRGGQARALLGQPEGSWLDAKRQPYRLGDAARKLELAKDVASFANAAGGGIIVLGLRTTKVAGREVLEELRPFPESLLDTSQYRDIIRDRVFPQVAGLEVASVQMPRGKTVGFVLIPPQPLERQPFLVRGAVADGRVLGHHISIPIRDGEETWFDDVGSIHSLLQAGRAALRQAPEG